VTLSGSILNFNPKLAPGAPSDAIGFVISGWTFYQQFVK